MLLFFFFVIMHCSCRKYYLLTLTKLGFLNHFHDVVINLLVQPFKIKNNFLLTCLLLKPSIFPRPRCQFLPVFDMKSMHLCKSVFEFEQVQLDLSIENHGPKQQKADTFLKIVQSQPPRQSPSQAQKVQLSSSGANNPCQGMWQTLEKGSSPFVLSL